MRVATRHVHQVRHLDSLDSPSRHPETSSTASRHGCRPSAKRMKVKSSALRRQHSLNPCVRTKYQGRQSGKVTPRRLSSIRLAHLPETIGTRQVNTKTLNRMKRSVALSTFLIWAKCGGRGCGICPLRRVRDAVLSLLPLSWAGPKDLGRRSGDGVY